ncbi:MAG: nitroreductase [Bacteroidales bacterium]|nr:nitroreductase [Bacteroidales bacterium]
MKPIKLALIAFAIMATISCNEAPVQQESQYDNAAIENMMTRRSIRKYTAEPVSREILTKIMECGINAPNGQNKQSWEVRIVDNPAVMDEIKDAIAKGHPQMKPEFAHGCFRDAPIMVFIARDTTYPFSAYDCGMLSQNIMLSAWSYGVGSVCLASPVRMMMDNDACKPVLEKLGFSENYELSLCIGLGWPDESPEAKPRIMEKVKFID